MPGLHGHRLAAARPEPHEVDAQDQEEKGPQAPLALQGVALLGQRGKQIPRNHHHTKEDHAFVGEAGHAPPQAGRGGRCGAGPWSGSGVGAWRIGRRGFNCVHVAHLTVRYALALSNAPIGRGYRRAEGPLRGFGSGPGKPSCAQGVPPVAGAVAPLPGMLAPGSAAAGAAGADEGAASSAAPAPGSLLVLGRLLRTLSAGVPLGPPRRLLSKPRSSFF